MRNFENEEIEAIRQLVTRDPSYSELDDTKLREKIEQMMEVRIKQLQDPETIAFYSALSFRSKGSLGDTVFESIRGLGILGKIISDKTITEVMINGYDNIFVERDGKLEHLNEHF